MASINDLSKPRTKLQKNQKFDAGDIICNPVLNMQAIEDNNWILYRNTSDHHLTIVEDSESLVNVTTLVSTTITSNAIPTINVGDTPKLLTGKELINILTEASKDQMISVEDVRKNKITLGI